MIRYGLLILALVPIIFIPVSATPFHYGISLSKTCLTMLQNELETDCPTYDEILVLFPDTTNQNVVGGFKSIDGITQRGLPNVIHPERFYTHATESILWVDPPNDVRKKLIMIEINPSLPIYKTGKESLIMDDYSVSFGKDRYVNFNCSESKITAENWVFLTGDSLNLMKHNCDPIFTSFNSTVSLKFEKSYQDLSTSAKYKLDQFIKESLEKYKVSFIGSNEKVINEAVTTDENE